MHTGYWRINFAKCLQCLSEYEKKSLWSMWNVPSCKIPPLNIFMEIIPGISERGFFSIESCETEIVIFDRCDYGISHPLH